MKNPIGLLVYWFICTIKQDILQIIILYHVGSPVDEPPWVTAAAGGLANIEDFWRRMTSILYYILRPVLTDNPGDEAEADHGDDPGGQQTLHGGVWRPRGATMSQSCHDSVTQQQQCHGVTTRRPG